MGFPQAACPGILDFVRRWDEIEVDWPGGFITNHSQGTRLAFEPLSEADRQMLEAGGIVGYLHARDRADSDAH